MERLGGRTSQRLIVDIALRRRHVSGIEPIESLRDRSDIAALKTAAIRIRHRTTQGLDMLVDGTDAVDDLRQLLPDDILKLHTGQRVDEHLGQNVAAVANLGQHFLLANGHLMVIFSQFAQLLRKRLQRLAFAFDPPGGELILIKLFDDFGDRRDAIRNFSRGFVGLIGEFSDFVGDHREPAPPTLRPGPLRSPR